jgi:ribosomal protein L35AE/L33A
MSGSNGASYGQQIKRNTQRVLFGAIILLIAFVLFAYLRGNGQSDTVEVTPDMAAIGDTVSVNNVVYTVKDVKESAEYNGETTDNKFVIVTLTAANDGKKEAEVYSELFYLYDSDGREFKGDVKRDIGNSGGYFGYGATIAPGLDKSGQVAFEVPSTSTGFKFAIANTMVATKGTEYVYVNLQ